MQEQSIRILVIEDNPGDARLIRETLRDAEGSFEVEVRDHLGAGLARLAGGAIDLVLVDLSLPDAQGMEAFAKVNAHAPEIPIVVLTGFDDEAMAVRAVNEGAQDYLVKGRVPPELLARSIRYAIERHRMVAELRRLDAAKTRFIADAAHELRQPLSTLAGYAHILATRAETMDHEQTERVLEAIDHQSEHITLLISNLLDLSQLEQQRLMVDLEVVSASASARRALDIAPPPPGKTVELHLPDDMEILADMGRLDQIFINLLTNAYRYGGDTITIDGSRTRDSVIVSVCDNGPGIPATLVPHLFQPFARGADASVVRGSGLGLAIVRKIAHSFGGDAIFEPNHPCGACFRLHLRAAG